MREILGEWMTQGVDTVPVLFSASLIAYFTILWVIIKFYSELEIELALYVMLCSTLLGLLISMYYF